MAISKKPTATPISEANIKAIIEKGGSAVQTEKEDTARKNLQLRLEPSLITQIDLSRKERMVPPSRHTWILEAIHEKIQRDSNVKLT
jgi:hypothetical protein